MLDNLTIIGQLVDNQGGRKYFLDLKKIKMGLKTGRSCGTDIRYELGVAPGRPGESCTTWQTWEKLCYLANLGKVVPLYMVIWVSKETLAEDNKVAGAAFIGVY